jgi:hypothetical protein
MNSPAAESNFQTSGYPFSAKIKTRRSWILFGSGKGMESRFGKHGFYGFKNRRHLQFFQATVFV